MNSANIFSPHKNIHYIQIIITLNKQLVWRLLNRIMDVLNRHKPGYTYNNVDETSNILCNLVSS